MVPRRTLLALLTGSLAGCLGGDSQFTSPTKRHYTVTERTKTRPTHTRSDSPSTPTKTSPNEWPPPEWNADWRHDLAGRSVLGLDIVDDRLIITANGQNKKTVVESFAPKSQSVKWTRKLTGDPVSNSILRREDIARFWGVSRIDNKLLAVTETDDNSRFRLHALNQISGGTEWSIQREKRLLVRGIADKIVYVLGISVPEQETSHQHGSDTPTPVPLDAELLAINQTDGSIRWSRSFRGVGDVRADDRGAYVAEMNRLHCYGHGGDRKWTVSGNHRGDAVFAGDEVIFFLTKPRWNRLFVTGVTSSGEIGWRKQFDADTAQKREGILYVAREGLWAVRPDGSIKWYSPGSASRFVFPEDGDQMYVRSGKRANAVDKVALDDGSREWRFAPQISNAWPEAASSRNLVAGGIGESGTPLYRVDTTSGRATGRRLGEHLTTTLMGEHAFVGTSIDSVGARVLALPL